MEDTYEFELINEIKQYNSSRDKTNIAPDMIVKNSKNVWKKTSGTIANRDGLKARGPFNATQAGVVSNFEWNTQMGERIIRVTSDGKLSVEYDNGNGNGLQWYDLLTGLIKTRFIFSGSYFDTNQDKQILLACNGSVRQIYNWEGGITTVAKTTSPVAGVITQGFNYGYQISVAGTGYSVGDTLTLVGGDGTAQVPVTAIGASGKITGLGFMTPQGSGYAQTTYATTVSSPSSGSGATILVLFVYSGGTLTTTSSLSFLQQGFSKAFSVVNGGLVNNAAQWQFIYNGTVYSYGGGVDEQTLTGITPDPSSIPVGAVIMSPFIVVNNIPVPTAAVQFSLSLNYTCDFISVINNQLYLGSYGSSLIFVASQTDYTNFTPVSNGAVGTPFTFELDTNAIGISQKNYVPIIFGGTSDEYQVNISSQVVSQGSSVAAITIQVVGITKITFAENEAPISQEFIDSNGEYIVWLGQDNQVHVFGAFKDILLSDKAPIISVPVEDELKDINFSGGALRFIGQYIYVTAPLIATHFFYRHREYVDESASQRSILEWMPPQIAGVSRFANIGGIVFGYSNLNPMLYQIYDTNQWHDDSSTGDPMPYECVMALAYRQLPTKDRTLRRQGKLRFDKTYVEGYMARGTPLYADILFDYQGATDIQTIQINTVAKPAKLFSYASAPPLGLDALGDNPLGDGINPSVDEQDYLPKFRSIRKTKYTNCYEYSIEIYSYDLDARWEILSLGTNMALAPESPRDLLA